jgi:hypothetical protein
MMMHDVAGSPDRARACRNIVLSINGHVAAF